MQALPRTKSCFVCGVENPLGLKLQSVTDGQIVTASFTPRPEHVGFADTVHGGILATVLDEVMVWACGVITGQFAFCAELAVRYLKPVRPGAKLTAVSELAANRRGRLFEAKAELRLETGQVVVAATGKYMPVPHAALMGMLGEFVDPLPAFLKLPAPPPGSHLP